MTLYLKVTKDKYELPVAVADSKKELARMLGRILEQIEDIEAEFGRDPEKLREASYELTGIDVAKTTTTDRRDTA